MKCDGCEMNTPRDGKASIDLLDRVIEVVGKWMQGLDRWLIPIGWMFGLMFLGFGSLSLFTGEGMHVGLTALGIGLLALSRAAAAGTYARRHRCRCSETGGIPFSEGGGSAESSGHATR